MITREQVHVGDVVEAWRAGWTVGTKVVGPVVAQGNALVVADFVVGWLDGAELDEDKVVTVVSRAPRPLYINHPRTEPVPGDVVRDADSDRSPRVWMHLGGGRNDWAGHRIGDMVLFTSGEMPARLRLLVDGETGQVVQ